MVEGDMATFCVTATRLQEMKTAVDINDNWHRQFFSLGNVETNLA
jgi:hypothetical protein